MWGRTRGRRLVVALAVSTVWAASIGANTVAGAATAANLIVQAADMPGQRHVSPGDWISAGYVFQLRGDRVAANADFHFQNAVARVELGCDGNAAVWELDVSLREGPYAVAESNRDWVPTNEPSSVQTYQGAAQVPGGDRCPGGQRLQVIHDGLSFAATVTSTNDTLDRLRAKFHAWDANANTPEAGNVDCASPSQNPVPDGHNSRGIAACDGGWAPSPPDATAAPYVPPGAPLSPAPSPRQHSRSSPGPLQPSQFPPPGSGEPGSAAGLSNPAPAPATSRGGGPVDNNSPGAATPLPGAAPVVIGSNSPLGSAPPLTPLSSGWVPMLAVVPLALLGLVLMGRRRSAARPTGSPQDLHRHHRLGEKL